MLEAYEDFCLGFFLTLRDQYHYKLSAEMLLNYLAISPHVDLADENAVCLNMMMFFCHQQQDIVRFPDIFHAYYCSEKAQSHRRIRNLEQQQKAGQNKNQFIQNPNQKILSEQKVYMTLPNYEAENTFTLYETVKGKCQYSSFIHAGFLNLYDDYIDHFDSLPEFGQKQLIGDITRVLQGFVHYCQKEIPDSEEICRKSLELSAQFKMAGNQDTDGNGPQLEPDEQELEREIEEEKLRYANMEEHRLTVAEDLTHKDVRLLTKKDIDMIMDYIRQNAYKFKARISRQLKQSGKREFDCKQTVKEAFHTNMIPIELVFNNPRPKKYKIVCLLDTSPSCISCATVLIHFLYQLKEVFKGGVDLFFFTDHVEKVSDEIKSRTIKDVIDETVEHSKHTVSQYSEVFEELLNSHSSAITKDTIFLLLGDMRNNYKPYQKEPLHRIHTKVHQGQGKTILLNTQKKRRWYSDDSILRRAEENLDEIYEVCTVADIIYFLDQL